MISETLADGDDERYLGLHYPASDIPTQVRALFCRKRLRMLVDNRSAPAHIVPPLNPRTARPLDLSFADFRGSSVMYTDYLENMGVRATLTMSILVEGKLWGMVACHHDRPRAIPYDIRLGCNFLARTLGLQLELQLARERAAYQSAIDKIREHLTTRLMAAADDREALMGQQPGVAQLLACDGAALVASDKVFRHGTCPSAEELRSLVKWCATREPGDLVLSESLADDGYPRAAEIAEYAAGVLATPFNRSGGEWLLWLRREQARTVNWAGDPNKPVSVGTHGERLMPRTSFALWQESVRGHSAPWQPAERTAVRRLRAAMAEVMFRRAERAEEANTLLRQSNAELDAFTYVASHDLKEPLRSIRNYSEFLLEDFPVGAVMTEDGHSMLERLIALADRMNELIGALLHFSRSG
ncbi:MAG: histidine kinase dimerization/phospho-acceptor domain-containing protein, partial [Myxococcota bacterium]